MKGYIEVRMQCEDDDWSERLEHDDFETLVVLEPGHYWPYLLKPGD
jgi:hypothetical protein